MKLVPEFLRRRLAARHASPWRVGELEQLSLQADWSVNVPRQGPQPPPNGPAKPKPLWAMADRQSDPELTRFRMFPQADRTPRVLDDFPHA